jgi:hypothetical protein
MGAERYAFLGCGFEGEAAVEFFGHADVQFAAVFSLSERFRDPFFVRGYVFENEFDDAGDLPKNCD